MRISDWSSDVCFSDLGQARFESDHGVGLLGGVGGRNAGQLQHLGHVLLVGVELVLLVGVEVVALVGQAQAALHGVGHVHGRILEVGLGAEAEQEVLAARRAGAQRSEEHTSELQSLMRTSYAVFCLKKKNHHKK